MYMYGIQNIVEVVVWVFLKEMYERYNGEFLVVFDYMDDGIFIKLIIIIKLDGLVVFDFVGIGDEVCGNINVFEVIIYFVIIYVLCCIVKFDIFFN